MDRNDYQGNRRLRIHGIPLPEMCKRCASQEWEGSTVAVQTPLMGPPDLQEVQLPLLRCRATACHQVYLYNRVSQAWETFHPTGDTFVPVEDLDPYMKQWG